jgi:hypothetical protein
MRNKLYICQIAARQRIVVAEDADQAIDLAIRDLSKDSTSRCDVSCEEVPTERCMVIGEIKMSKVRRSRKMRDYE